MIALLNPLLLHCALKASMCRVVVAVFLCLCVCVLENSDIACVCVCVVDARVRVYVSVGVTYSYYILFVSLLFLLFLFVSPLHQFFSSRKFLILPSTAFRRVETRLVLENGRTFFRKVLVPRPCSVAIKRITPRGGLFIAHVRILTNDSSD